MILLKSPTELDRMREAGQIVADALRELASRVGPGVTTAQLSDWGEALIEKAGAVPSFKGYRGFPAAITVCVNEELVHGIPGPRVLNEGDIVSLDLGVIFGGFQGDAAVTVPVGHVGEEALRLLDATEGALRAGIDRAHPGNRVGDISAAVQGHAETRGFEVVRKYVGHGIGREMHEPPQVPNFGAAGHGPALKPGTTLALEPMVSAGGSDTRVLDDNWTVVTSDGSLSAHFEHTIAVTEDGPEVLTAAP